MNNIEKSRFFFFFLIMCCSILALIIVSGDQWIIKDVNIYNNSLGEILNIDKGNLLLNSFSNAIISKNKIGNECK